MIDKELIMKIARSIGGCRKGRRGGRRGDVACNVSTPDNAVIAQYQCRLGRIK
jgi:hypothetical protein